MKSRQFILTGGLMILCFIIGFSGYAATRTGSDRNARYYPMADLKYMEYKGQIDSIDQKDAYIVVNQTVIHIVSNMVLKDGASITTECVDQGGHAIPFSSFRNGQWVNVKAYKASDRYTFAVRILRRNILPKDKAGTSLVPK